MGKFFVYRPDILKRVAILGFMGIVILIGLNIRAHYVYLSSNFNGRIDSIRYGEKGSAFIILKGREYVLDGAWTYSPNNKVFIQKGDSIVKYKDSTQIKLIKSNGMTIIN